MSSTISTTGTQNFAAGLWPTLGDLTLYALNRVDVRPTMVSTDHLTIAASAANLVLADWSTEQPNLWKVVLNAVPLVQGVNAYTLPPNVLQVMDTFLRMPIGSFSQTDRILGAASRSEYDGFPNKLLQAPPTTVWIERTVPVVLHVYPTPEQSSFYTLNYHCIQQNDDAVLNGGLATDIPYRMLKAFVDALTAELALTYAPDKFQMFMAVAKDSKQRANTSDRENVNLVFAPGLARYWSQY